jgi:hypothetical protein
MANTLLTISMITNEALRVLVNNLAFTNRVNRQYSSKFAIEGAKIGTVINARKPPRYVGRTGTAIGVEDATETQVPVTLTTQFGVDISFSSADLTLSISDFSNRFIKPAIATIANKIDFDGLQLFKTVANSVGTPGTTPNSLLTYLLAGVKLDDNSTPMDGERSCIVNPLMQATIVDALKGLFQSSTEIKAQYEKGMMGTAAGFDWYMDQNVGVATIGPQGGTPLVNGASQSGSSLIVDGFTAAAASRLVKGDVFTIAGVFGVNPQNRQSTGALQQFVVTAAVSSDAAGNATIPIFPAITLTGAFQTVTALPADNAALTVVGAANTVSPQGMAFHKDAFTFVSADLQLPRGVDMAARVSDPETGLSVRMVRQYVIATDQFPCRLDILYGWKELYPENACRIQA